MAGRVWWSKAAHFVATGKKRERGGEERAMGKIPLRGIFPKTYFLQLGPSSE
jgi:hypothetical protein